MIAGGMWLALRRNEAVAVKCVWLAWRIDSDRYPRGKTGEAVCEKKVRLLARDVCKVRRVLDCNRQNGGDLTGEVKVTRCRGSESHK